MSWDVFLYSEDPRPYPKGVAPPPLGSEAGVMAILAEAFPEQEWIHENILHCEVQDGILRFSFDTANDQVIFVLGEVCGGPGALAALMRFCRDRDWVAWQPTEDVLLNLTAPTSPSWEEYQAERASAWANPLDFCGQKWRPSRPSELILFLFPSASSQERVPFTLQCQFAPLWLQQEDYASEHRTFVVDVDGSFPGLTDYRQLDGAVVEGREAIYSEGKVVLPQLYPPDIRLWSMGPGGIHHHAVDGWDARLTLGPWREQDHELDYMMEAFYPGPRALAANEELRLLESAYEDISDDDPRWSLIEEGWQFRYSGVLHFETIQVSAPVNAADPIGWAKAKARRHLQLNDFGFCKVNGGDYDGSFKPTDGLGPNGRLVCLHPATSSYRQWLARQKKS